MVRLTMHVPLKPKMYQKQATICNMHTGNQTSLRAMRRHDVNKYE